MVIDIDTPIEFDGRAHGDKMFSIIESSLRIILEQHFDRSDVKIVIVRNKDYRAHIYCDILVGPLGPVKALVYLLKRRLYRLLIANDKALDNLIDAGPTLKRMIRLPYTDKIDSPNRFYRHPDDHGRKTSITDTKKMIADLMLQPTDENIRHMVWAQSQDDLWLMAKSSRARELAGPRVIESQINKRIYDFVDPDCHVRVGEVLDDNGWVILANRRSRFFAKWISCCLFVYRVTADRITLINSVRDWEAAANATEKVCITTAPELRRTAPNRLLSVPISFLGFCHGNDQMFKDKFNPKFLAEQMNVIDLDFSGIVTPLNDPERVNVQYTLNQKEDLNPGDYVSDRIGHLIDMPISPNYRVEVIEAECGAGKTVALSRRLANVFRQRPDSRIIVIAPRVSLVRQLKEVLVENINAELDNPIVGHCYADGATPAAAQLIATTVHSLPKFKDELFDVIMIDEIETVALSLATDNTLAHPSDRRQRVLDAFTDLAPRAHLILAIDRDIGLASNMMLAIFINAQQRYTIACADDPMLALNRDCLWHEKGGLPTITEHVKIGKARKIRVVEFSIQYALHWLSEMFKAKKRVVVFQTSCERVYQLEHYLKEAHPEIKVLTITGVSTTNTRTEFAENPDSRVTESNCDILIHTSTVGIGVSITVDHFDARLAMANGILSARELVQGMHRVRKVSDNEEDQVFYVAFRNRNKKFDPFKNIPTFLDELDVVVETAAREKKKHNVLSSAYRTLNFSRSSRHMFIAALKAYMHHAPKVQYIEFCADVENKGNYLVDGEWQDRRRKSAAERAELTASLKAKYKIFCSSKKKAAKRKLDQIRSDADVMKTKQRRFEYVSDAEKADLGSRDSHLKMIMIQNQKKVKQSASLMVFFLIFFLIFF